MISQTLRNGLCRRALSGVRRGGPQALRASSTAAPTQPTQDQRLRNDVKMLGTMLGETIQKHNGDSTLKDVEDLRALARKWRSSEADLSQLVDRVNSMSTEEILAVAKAFTHFFSLANAAESHHRVRRLREWVVEEDAPGVSRRTDTTLGTIERLLAENSATPEQIVRSLSTQKVELVLTAHPTEVNRRTMIAKHAHVSKALKELDDLSQGKGGVPRFESQEAQASLKRAVEAIWNSDQVRRVKPTPQDEARAGVAIIEQVLWDAVPSYLRRLDAVLQDTLGKNLPMHVAPIRFGSWVGGDRDGNPNVTPEVTQEISFLSRWQAALLFLQDVRALRMELSTTKCTNALREATGLEAREPYREVLKGVEAKLVGTLDAIQEMLNGTKAFSVAALPLSSRDQILQPLGLMYRSLVETGQEALARGPLLDVIRRAACFGVCLAPLDVRQESTRHTEALDAITRYLGVGSYAQWDESTRQSWLLAELQGKRPLLPRGSTLTDLGFDETVQDTLRTFDVIAGLGSEALGAYVISMATSPSDVLAVKLLQKEAGLPWEMRVVPLFETLGDLDGSEDTLRTLLGLPWYRGHINGSQEVMIGYSDSAKDAGRLAAAWAQYQAQERLAKVAEEEGIKLTFFHGKGGTVSRGGNPALYDAILAQPVNTVNGRFRVTEQGEMITQNFGDHGIAERTLDIYTAGVLHDRFKQPVEPTPEWRDVMDALSAKSCDSYRHFVREDPRFVPYFRMATPELELAALNIGSRPAKRRPTGGVETLRAIPWVFAWTQTRLHLPAWLGVGQALSAAAQEGGGKGAEKLREMYRKWPFFSTNIDLFEMILAKGDTAIAEHYDSELVTDADARELGKELRGLLGETASAVLDVSGNSQLIEHNTLLRWQLELRNPYIDPINIMQAHILRRLRSGDFSSAEEEERLQDALVITIKGIAGGMRNTG